jgi:predicted Zn-dependent protease
LLIRARLLEELDIEECWRTYTEALERLPNHAAVPLRAAVWSYKHGDLARARQLLMRSWHLSPAPETGYYCMIYRAQGNEEQALAYFVQTIALEGEGGHWRKQAEQQLQSK